MSKLKDLYYIKEIDKKSAHEFVSKNHYLGDRQFMYTVAYGLLGKEDDSIEGVAVFGTVQGISSLKGWFGLDNSTTNVYELHRLAMSPHLNGGNATSYLLGNSMKLLKNSGARAVVTLADSSLHLGFVYQACNFKYYGLSDKKTDFFTEDGRLNPRGATKDVRGVWLPRTRKHRYAFMFDKTLEVKYKELRYPKSEGTIKLECCNGTGQVHDKRFDVMYTCPRCCGEIVEIPYDDTRGK